MLKGLGNLKDLLSQAKGMQEELADLQQKSAAMRISTSVGAGMINVVASGDQKIIDIKINRDLYDPRDIDMLEELIISGVNQALTEARAAVAQQMQRYTNKFNLKDLEKNLKDTLLPTDETKK